MDVPGDLACGVELPGQLLGQPGHLIGTAQHGPALRRQRHRMAHPLEQAHVQLRLQLFDLKGHRGLGKAQFPGRFGEAPQLRHLDEGAQVFHIHTDPRYHLVYLSCQSNLSILQMIRFIIY